MSCQSIVWKNCFNFTLSHLKYTLLYSYVSWNKGKHSLWYWLKKGTWASLARGRTNMHAHRNLQAPLLTSDVERSIPGAKHLINICPTVWTVNTCGSLRSLNELLSGAERRRRRGGAAGASWRGMRKWTPHTRFNHRRNTERVPLPARWVRHFLKEPGEDSHFLGSGTETTTGKRGGTSTLTKTPWRRLKTPGRKETHVQWILPVEPHGEVVLNPRSVLRFLRTDQSPVCVCVCVSSSLQLRSVLLLLLDSLRTELRERSVTSPPDSAFISPTPPCPSSGRHTHHCAAGEPPSHSQDESNESHKRLLLFMLWWVWKRMLQSTTSKIGNSSVFKGIVLHKNENPLIVYSPLCRWTGGWSVRVHETLWEFQG